MKGHFLFISSAFKWKKIVKEGVGCLFGGLSKLEQKKS